MAFFAGVNRPKDHTETMGNTVRFRRASGGPTDRHQPKPKRLDWDDAGQDYLSLSYRGGDRCQMKSSSTYEPGYRSIVVSRCVRV